ncbi:MAG: D-amino acid aminotransferase [Steroidobacteraceae bacterium]|jgi:D-alanine transaminase|nr:D-amino acid aminotransferase [Steroidobacteraceae bacterium]
MLEPLPICYLNGAYLPLSEARISPLDRGFLFADSVYEVLPVYGGRMFRFCEHFDRLARSLNEIRLASPHTHEQWLGLLEELIRRNGGGDMYVYVQVTRGADRGRNHAFPAPPAAPTVFAMAAPLPATSSELRTQGLSAITVQDFRWTRCDIKATALLANILMKQQAADAGADEAIIIREGEVLEGASSSVFAVIGATVVTRANDHNVLPGTTRDVALELAAGLVEVHIRPITVEELRSAREVWITSATRSVAPVTRIDGAPVGDGRPGPVWTSINQHFEALRARLADTPSWSRK